MYTVLSDIDLWYTTIIMASQDKLKIVFDTLPGAFFLTNTQGQVVYANNALERRTGFAVGEIVGKAPSQLWGGGMDRGFYADFWDTIKDKKIPFISNIINLKKDRQIYSERMCVSPVLNVDGGLEYFLEIAPDFSGKKDEVKFENEFRLVLSRQLAHGASVIDWLLPWFESGAKVGGGSGLLSDFFTEVLIAPMRECYSARLEDKELVFAAQRERQEFRLLYLKYKKDVENYFLRRMGKEKGIAYELAQETFLRAFKYLASFRATNASYQTYLLRIAHNLLANNFRIRENLSLDEIPDSFIRIEPVYEDPIQRKKILEAIAVCLEVEQQVLKMKYEQDFSIREIAIILQKSENAVKLHLSRARKKLKEVL